jgi:DUF1680 family protein
VQAESATYARIERSWKAGEMVTLNMPVNIRLIEDHPRIEGVRHQVAIQRGPVVYCLETPDLPEGTTPGPGGMLEE